LVVWKKIKKNKIMALSNKVFIQKSVGGLLYKWSPTPNNFSKNKSNNKQNQRPFYCDAISGSQGQDWITTYVYNLEVVNSKQAHFAYVECDYVE
jgi:hypothetical protein